MQKALGYFLIFSPIVALFTILFIESEDFRGAFFITMAMAGIMFLGFRLVQ